MFTAIEPHIYHKWENILDQTYRLRKKTFYDTLKWNVSVQGDHERDVYDDHGPVYVTWHDSQGENLYGTIRLMPTTGPTLLHDIFSDTFPDTAALSAPDIWEATRICFDLEKVKSGFPGFPTWKAFGLLALAAIELAQEHGIHTLAANYEPPLKRIYERAGATIDELGRADGYGQQPVCCGLFEISERVVYRMRERLGVDGPLFGRPEALRTLAA